MEHQVFSKPRRFRSLTANHLRGDRRKQQRRSPRKCVEQWLLAATAHSAATSTTQVAAVHRRQSWRGRWQMIRGDLCSLLPTFIPNAKATFET